LRVVDTIFYQETSSTQEWCFVMNVGAPCGISYKLSTAVRYVLILFMPNV